MIQKEAEKMELINKAKAWAASPEGKESVKKISQQAEEIKKQLRESCKIDPAKLNEPFTI
ncbi:MAG: hypothetical protein AB1656_17285 [Candidatus Omnitrophota bacterium]